MVFDFLRFKKNVKESFLKAKQDIQFLKKTLNDQNESISQILLKLEALEVKLNVDTSKKSLETMEFPKIDPFPQEIKGSNQSINQSLINQSEVNKRTISFNKGIENLFLSLPRKQYLTFLELYRLDEIEKGVTYQHLAEQLGISEECLRGYISSLIKKGAPILKSRFNNNIIFLSILEDFKSLNLKKKLEDIFYKKDINQRRLSDLY